MTEPEFRQLFRDHKDVVYRVAYRMTGSVEAAEDVVQDCFVALWRKPEAFDAGRGSVRAFLLGIARNLILKRWRDGRERLVDEFDELESDVLISLPADLVAKERSEAVALAVQQLPPLQREVLILFEYEEMTLGEIAKVTGAELAAVKSRLHRARENLRKLLQPLLDERSQSEGRKHGT